MAPLARPSDVSSALPRLAGRIGSSGVGGQPGFGAWVVPACQVGLRQPSSLLLPGEAILQARVPELIDRARCTQHVLLTGTLEEAQKPDRGAVADRQLNERQAERPRRG